MNELQSVFINNVAAIVTTAIFIWYLVRKDKSQEDALTKFNETVNNHLKHSSEVLKENVETRVKFMMTIESLVSVVKNLSDKIK